MGSFAETRAARLLVGFGWRRRGLVGSLGLFGHRRDRAASSGSFGQNTVSWADRWVRSAKTARLSRELRAAGFFPTDGFATEWSFRRLRAGTTIASAKIAFPVNNRKNTGEFSTGRRVGALSREGEGTGFVRAAATGFVLPNLPFPPNLTWAASPVRLAIIPQTSGS